jgi:iron(III) transport system substrate-binding protein
MKRFKTAVAVLVLIALLFTGCSSGEGTESPAENQPTAQSEPEKEMPKELTMYIGVVEQHALALAEAFEEETGIKVNFVRMSGGETLGRIRAEKENPQASVWYGGPADTYIAAKAEGLLQPYISTNTDKIPTQFKDEEGYWTGVYIEYLGFVSDGRFFDENQVELPKSWDDLLNPAFENQIIVANPGSSGTAYAVLATQVQKRGEEEALAYMKELDSQVKQYTKSGSAPAKSAALGEAAIGITFIHNGIRQMEAGFTDIRLSMPEDGTGYSIGAIGIIEGAPELEAAKIFIDWALEKETQEIGQILGSYQFLTNQDANQPEQVAQFADTKLIDYDFNWAGDNRNRLVEAWNQAIKE